MMTDDGRQFSHNSDTAKRRRRAHVCGPVAASTDFLQASAAVLASLVQLDLFGTEQEVAVNATGSAVGTPEKLTIPDTGLRAVSVQAVLLALSAAVLPALCHVAGLPVRWLLPMHWAVLLAGLIYGWRAGAAIGVLAPSVSFLISGMPLPHILHAMTIELGTYGLVAGASRQWWRLGGIASTLVAIVAGRAVFVAAALLTGATAPSLTVYARAALLPGVAAAIAQLLLLPLVAAWWVRREPRS